MSSRPEPRKPPAPRRAPALVAVLLLTAACAQLPAGPVVAPPSAGASGWGAPEPRTVFLPGRGVLELALPRAWTVSVEEGRPGEEAPPLAFRIAPPDGRFRAYLTPLPPDGNPLVGNVRRARDLAEAARRAAEPRSAEGKLVLQELKVAGAPRGYWFYATDPELTARTPGLEEWRGLVSGFAAAGDLLFAFTLFDELSGKHRAALLDAVATARHLPPDPGEPALALVPFLAAAQLVLPLPAGVGAVAVRAPGFLVTRPLPTEEAGASAAYARDPASGVHVALAVREAPAAGTARACRTEPVLRLRGTGGVRELVESEHDDAARVSYLTPPGASDKPGQERWHIREWRARGGLCVEVHLSAVAGGAGTGIVEPILRSVRFEPAG